MTIQNKAQDSDSPESEMDPLAKSERELDMAISELRGEKADLKASANPAGKSDATAETKAAEHPLRRSSDNSVIMSIPVNVDVVLGTTEMPVHELMALKKGTAVALDRRIGEPVDVVVSGRRIARGEIIVLEDDPTRFGIRLIDVVEG